MTTKHGTIVVEIHRWRFSGTEGRSWELTRSERRQCKKTALRFILSGIRAQQFNHSGECVAHQGDTYKYSVLPETFEAIEAGGDQ